MLYDHYKWNHKALRDVCKTRCKCCPKLKMQNKTAMTCEVRTWLKSFMWKQWCHGESTSQLQYLHKYSSHSNYLLLCILYWNDSKMMVYSSTFLLSQLILYAVAPHPYRTTPPILDYLLLKKMLLLNWNYGSCFQLQKIKHKSTLKV